MGYLIPKSFLQKNNIQSILARDNGVYNIPKGISPKVNVIAWLKLELASYDVAAQHIRHYSKKLLPSISIVLLINYNSFI